MIRKPLLFIYVFIYLFISMHTAENKAHLVIMSTMNLASVDARRTCIGAAWK